MRELTIQIPDELFGPVRKILQNLRGVQVTKTRKLPPTPASLTAGQQEFVAGLRSAFAEVAAHERGEIELQSVEDHIRELRAERAAGLEHPAAIRP